MYFKNNFQTNIKFLKFLVSNDNSYNSQKEIIYTTTYLEKIDNIKIFVTATNAIKNTNKLKLVIAVSRLMTNLDDTAHTVFDSPSIWPNKFNFYSSYINTNLKNYTNKNNFVNIQITNLTLYLSLKKYSFIFSKDKKNIHLESFLITNVPEIFQEITEIKPDKTKKVYFKKKQMKTYTYVNETNKNYVYTDISENETDEKILEKDLFIKNIFLNAIADKSEAKTIYNTHCIVANKSLSFWKKYNLNASKSGIILDSYYSNSTNTKYLYQIRYSSTNNLIVETSPIDFDSSNTFTEFLLTKSSKSDFYKNIFIYNFINLVQKTTLINYSHKFTYFNHVPEFKDYFFKKVNPFSRDLVISNHKNKNKFNNFFPLYCLSFKKFKKLILLSKKQQSPAYSSYYMYYLVNFLELMCKKNIWIRINTKKQVSDEVYGKFTALFLKNKSDQVNIGKHFFLIEFYEIIYLSFINRDINFFAMWFKKIMEKIHLKKHRKMVKVIHSTIRNNLLFLELTGVKGFSMDVRGKLGTAGNSKKKHYAFTVGSIAPTTKSHGLNLYQTTVRTSTGVLGITILMSY